MKKSRKVIAIISAIGLLLIPIIRQNHIYNGIANGEDTKVFHMWIDTVANGGTFADLQTTYIGQKMVYGSLGFINRIFHLDATTLFVAFSFIVLFAIGITLYQFGKMVGGERTGWITLVMGLLSTTAILGLFSYAVIIEILNMYVILPWLIICLVKEWGNLRYFVGGIILAPLFLTLHPSGLYLVATAVCFMGYLVLTRKIPWWTLSWILPFAIMAWVFNGQWFSWTMPDWSLYHRYFVGFITDFLGIFTTIIVVIVIYVLWKYGKTLNPSTEWKRYIGVVGCLAFVLSIGSILRVTSLPERIMLDAASVLSILTALVLGELLKLKTDWLRVVYPIMAVGSINTLIAWVR